MWLHIKKKKKNNHEKSSSSPRIFWAPLVWAHLLAPSVCGLFHQRRSHHRGMFRDDHTRMIFRRCRCVLYSGTLWTWVSWSGINAREGEMWCRAHLSVRARLWLVIPWERHAKWQFLTLCYMSVRRRRYSANVFSPVLGRSSVWGCMPLHRSDVIRLWVAELQGSSWTAAVTHHLT